ncbi:DUF1611 domain-containing protein [Duganella sp. SAP-35]|uniref:DUF1611 domain-containing protein n=2 Tax=Duganella aceris TaxID=2703883 RepID=A0ABX0FKV6_9BURK|nr:DUF1611 domain-containing protein [Duganella aceris]
MNAYELPQPYLLFMGDATEAGFAKTALGLKDWAPERCVGEWHLPGGSVFTGLPELAPRQAYAEGARALLIGVAAVGGAIMPHWLPALVEALEAGLDLISGMHTRMADTPVLVEAAARCGRRLYDVRTPPKNLPIGKGNKRSGRRLLTVGTDCALGKKYTALALTTALQARDVAVSFRATGQTGIMIAGAGIPIDAVVSDFVAGAAELLSPAADGAHWDIIEGQGSLFHPSFAGVSLGLLHGSQPDVLVLCHEAGRTHMLGLPDYPVPSLKEAIELHLALARRVNPAVRVAAVSLNTSQLSDAEALAAIHAVREELGIPCADPLRHPVEFAAVVDACLAMA